MFFIRVSSRNLRNQGGKKTLLYKTRLQTIMENNSLQVVFVLFCSGRPETKKSETLEMEVYSLMKSPILECHKN